MSNIPLKTLTFPGLNGTYTIPQVDTTLTTSGKAADAKKVGDEISDIKNDLNHLYTVGKNKAKFGQYGYILDGGSYTETSGTYYASTEPVYISAGQTICLSGRHGSIFIRVRIAKASDNTRIVYSTSFENTGERDYTVYTASQDCFVVVSYIATNNIQIEFSDTPTAYEAYEEVLNPEIKIPSVEEIEADVTELQRTKATVNISKNVYVGAESGYVSIQNTLIDASTNAYITSEWIDLANGEKIIVSGAKTFVRLYVGRNELPTTSGGSRIEYLTSFTDTTTDGRHYLSYTANENSKARVSFQVSDQMPMVEKTTNSAPSDYEEPGKKLDTDIIVTTAKSANELTNVAKENLDFSYWYGKKVLCIGDSLTAAGIWQQKLNSVLGMVVTTHAKGGISFPAMLDGSPSSGGSDPTLAPLATDDVGDKDLIIVYGGYNHRGSEDGQKGDLYPTSNTTYGCLQYLINGIYTLLNTANNLKCRLVVVTPHCAGKYSYIPYSWNEEYPVGSGRTGETLVEAVKACASDNWVACLDLYHTSGISPFTWDVFSASSTPETDGQVNDQLHLNPSVGYPYLGERIAHWVDTI